MNNIKNDIKLGQEFFSRANNAEDAVIEKCSEKTRKFIDKLSNSSTEIIKNFLANNAVEIPLRNKKSKLYHFDNLLLAITDGKSAYNIEQNLQNIKKENIAPKFINYYELGNNEFLSVLEGDSEALLPYSQELSSLSKQSKQAFKNGLKQAALSTQQVNKEIFVNKEPLFVGKSSRNIVYGDWENLSVIPTEMKQYYLNQIDKIM